jgi:predicted transposase/invertase (TIGR01784 family)
LGYTYIELSKFVKADTELETDLDRWLYILKNMSRMDKIPVYLRKPIFKKLFSIAEYTNLTKEEKTMYDSSLKYKWDNKNVLDYAVKEARQEGEHLKAVAIACEMKKESIPTIQIAKFTGLSVEEIENL